MRWGQRTSTRAPATLGSPVPWEKVNTASRSKRPGCRDWVRAQGRAKSGPGEEERARAALPDLGGAGDPAWPGERDPVQPGVRPGASEARRPGWGLGDRLAPRLAPAGGAALQDLRPAGETHLYRARVRGHPRLPERVRPGQGL